MRRLAFPLLILFVAASVRGETIDLGAYGRLSFTLDSAWEVVSVRHPDETVSVKLSTKSDVNAACSFEIILRPGPNTDTKAKLEAAIISDCKATANASVEKRTVPIEFTGKTGYGYSAGFTEPSLAGKPSVKGKSKVQTVVMLILTDKVGIVGNAFSDGFKEAAHRQFLAMFQSMEVVPGDTPKK